MKRILLILFFISNTSFSQQVSCDDLMDYVKTEGYKKGSISSYALFDSSWLKSVDAYQVDDVIVVIADIKKDEWGYSSKKYIFCDIPERNWRSFSSAYLNLNSTYGERFHEYILDFVCDCY